MTVSQKNWLDLLNSAQFAYNLHKSSSKGMSPFEVAMGQQPLTPYEISKQRSGGQMSDNIQICYCQTRNDVGSTRQFVESTAKNEKVC